VANRRVAAHIRGMKHCCACGQEYVLNPKEIPLSADETIFCQGCGRIVRGQRSTRYFDYEPIPTPKEAAPLSEKHPKRPRDPNQLANSIIDIVTGQSVDPPEGGFTKQAKAGDAKGRPAKARALTPEQRSEIARAAAAARWKKS
jgi:hypothetical protein